MDALKIILIGTFITFFCTMVIYALGKIEQHLKDINNSLKNKD